MGYLKQSGYLDTESLVTLVSAASLFLVNADLV